MAGDRERWGGVISSGRPRNGQRRRSDVSSAIGRDDAQRVCTGRKRRRSGSNLPCCCRRRAAGRYRPIHRHADDPAAAASAAVARRAGQRNARCGDRLARCVAGDGERGGAGITAAAALNGPDERPSRGLQVVGHEDRHIERACRRRGPRDDSSAGVQRQTKWQSAMTELQRAPVGIAGREAQGVIVLLMVLVWLAGCVSAGIEAVTSGV